MSERLRRSTTGRSGSDSLPVAHRPMLNPLPTPPGDAEPDKVKPEGSAVLDAEDTDVAEAEAHEHLSEIYEALDKIKEGEAKLQALKERAAKTMERLKPRTGSLSDLVSNEPAKRVSIPEWKYVPWGEVNTSSSIPSVHHAIAIPNAEPTLSELKVLLLDEEGTERTSYTEVAPKVVAVSIQEQQAEKMRDLPERITIYSERIKEVLDYDTWNGSLSYGEHEPFSILRPFKLLNHLGLPIRERLREFETARLEIYPATEEEYDKEYTDDPAEDDGFQEGRQNLELMTRSQITGFIKDLRCLTKFMDEYIIPAQDRFSKATGSVRFLDLWYVFPLGSLVYVKDKNIPQKVWKVIQRTGGRRFLSRPADANVGDFTRKFTPFVLDCYHLDYDGSRYVPTFHQFQINSFESKQQLTSLAVYPLHIAVKEGTVDKASLVECGRQFIECTKVSHRYYDGRCRTRTPKGEKLIDMVEGAYENYPNVCWYSERINSEVMVDIERALQEVPEWRPGIDTHSCYAMDINERTDSIGIDHDEVWDARLLEEFLEAEQQKWKVWERPESTGPVDDDDLLLLPDRVFAFVLRTRKWACLGLGKGSDGDQHLRTIIPRLEPWNNLELPDGHKDIIQSLIESHFSNDQSQRVHFDLVRDKGKGVIILLHGVPGVGKTSTAECAAESNNRPLLPITCGDLGLTPQEVETNLQESFQLAQAWGCVMLLDEADVFLSQRLPNDTKRNALVSVFLRVLEYYEGILFLTTNRVGSFDEAFKSRIHISLYYPPLDWYQTSKIWQSHIRKAMENQRVEADEDNLLRFASELFQQQSADEKNGPVWNGRQIRNAFQSAVALAGFKTAPGEPIKLVREHFEKVSRVSSHFNDYLWRVMGGRTDAFFAQQHRLRVDSWAPADPAALQGSPATQPMVAALPRPRFGSEAHRPVTPVPMVYQQQPMMVPQQAMQMGSTPPNAYPSPAQTFGLQPQYHVQPQTSASLQPQPMQSFHHQPQQTMLQQPSGTFAGLQAQNVQMSPQIQQPQPIQPGTFVAQNLGHHQVHQPPSVQS